MADTSGQEITSCSIAMPAKTKNYATNWKSRLSTLQRQYPLTSWHDREILSGEDWEKAIDAHLSTAHVIFLLISPHFMTSDSCYGKEMKKALSGIRPERAGSFPYSCVQSTGTGHHLAAYNSFQPMTVQAPYGWAASSCKTSS